MNLVSLESLLNLLLANAKISNFSKVDMMYLLLHWVTFAEVVFFKISCALGYFSLGNAHILPTDFEFGVFLNLYHSPLPVYSILDFK